MSLITPRITLRRARFPRILLAAVTLAALCAAQFAESQSPQSGAEHANPPDAEKDRLARHQAALGMLDLVLAGAKSLSLPQNRLAIESEAFPLPPAPAIATATKQAPSNARATRGMFGAPPNTRATGGMFGAPFGGGNRRNIRSTVEERRFQRRVKLPNQRGLQPPWSHFAPSTSQKKYRFCDSDFQHAIRARQALGESKIKRKTKGLVLPDVQISKTHRFGRYSVKLCVNAA